MIKQTNFLNLAEYYPELYRRVQSYKEQEKRFETLDTKSNDKTILIKTIENNQERQIYLHSKYNPQTEGRKFAEDNMKNQKKYNILFGFGMGYHVNHIFDLLEKGNQLYIFDTNLDVFIEALNHLDFNNVFKSSMVKMYISDDVQRVLPQLSFLLKEIDDDKINFITHVPSINAIDSSLQDYRDVLTELNLRKTISNQYLDLMEENSRYNKENIHKNVGLLFNKFKDIPIIIVCAGPSLDKNKHLLTGLDNKAVIICVGHALKSIIKIGVRPHFIITIDPQEIVYKQIEGLEDLDIPFILLATAAKINTQRYRGPKLIACQYPQYLGEGEEGFLVKTGGSVSTTALDIAIRMGGHPIIYIGQNLAYLNNQHHCNDTFHEEKDVKILKNMRTVKGEKGENGEILYTTLGMLSFKRWIEGRAREEKDKIFINATEGGAYIEGFTHMPFQEVISKYLTKSYDINNEISKSIS